MPTSSRLNKGGSLAKMSSANSSITCDGVLLLPDAFCLGKVERMLLKSYAFYEKD